MIIVHFLATKGTKKVSQRIEDIKEKHFLPVSGLGRIAKLRMIIVHFLATKGTKKGVTENRSYKVILLWAICFLSGK